MKEIYDQYHSYFLKSNAPTKEAFKSVSESYAFFYKKFLPKNKKAKILDLGCGMGHFLNFLKDEGYTDFWGIDISKGQIDFVKENITKNVEVADAFEFLKRERPYLFQVIVINDVIEHIPKKDLLDFLRLIFSSLENGGKIFVKTDNMSNPFGLRGRYMSITHEVCFTEHSLKMVLEVSGFKDVYLFPSSRPIKSIKSLIQRAGAGIVFYCLKILFRIQGFPPPDILTKDIIAVASKL